MTSRENQLTRVSRKLFKPNYPFYRPGDYTLLSTPERVGASPNFAGRGVVMAFIDSGFYPHPDLGDRVLAHVDATSNRIVEGRRFHAPDDYCWHGQMTSVVAAGDGRTSGGQYRGIASEARLVLIKVSTRRGRIKEPDILRGMNWLIENHQRFNVRVLNVSVGGDVPSPDPDHPLHRAVRRLTEAGIMVMVAAGNMNIPLLVPPASAPEAITVGGINDQNSLDRSLWLPYPNNYGEAFDRTPKPDVTTTAAWIASPILPGTTIEREARWLAPLLDLPELFSDEEDVSQETLLHIRRILVAGREDLGLLRRAADKPDGALLTLLQERINKYKLIDAHHQHVDGTSVSVAIASSVVAQMIEANPSLTPAEVKAILKATAKPLAGEPAEQQGAGIINPSATVERASEAPVQSQIAFKHYPE